MTRTSGEGAEAGVNDDLLQAFYKVEVGKHTVVAEYASSGIWSHKNGTNGFNPCGIGGEELFPKSALAGLDIQAIHTGGQLTGLIDV